MRPCAIPIEQLLPQARPMVLLDEVVGWSETAIEAALTVRPATPFLVPGKGVPAHVAIEWMAQACAAFVGAEAHALGLPVRIGFLLGTRDFMAQCRWFRVGKRFAVHATLDYRDGEMGVFGCTVLDRQEVVASAHLTVYQPRDVATILA